MCGDRLGWRARALFITFVFLLSILILLLCNYEGANGLGEMFFRFGGGYLQLF